MKRRNIVESCACCLWFSLYKSYGGEDPQNTEDCKIMGPVTWVAMTTNTHFSQRKNYSGYGIAKVTKSTHEYTETGIALCCIPDKSNQRISGRTETDTS